MDSDFIIQVSLEEKFFLMKLK